MVNCLLPENLTSNIRAFDFARPEFQAFFPFVIVLLTYSYLSTLHQVITFCNRIMGS